MIIRTMRQANALLRTPHRTPFPSRPRRGRRRRSTRSCLRDTPPRVIDPGRPDHASRGVATKTAPTPHPARAHLRRLDHPLGELVHLFVVPAAALRHAGVGADDIIVVPVSGTEGEVYKRRWGQRTFGYRSKALRPCSERGARGRLDWTAAGARGRGGPITERRRPGESKPTYSERGVRAQASRAPEIDALFKADVRGSHVHGLERAGLAKIFPDRQVGLRPRLPWWFVQKRRPMGNDKTTTRPGRHEGRKPTR